MPLIDKNGFGIVSLGEVVLYAIGEESFFKFENERASQIDCEEYREMKFNTQVKTNEFLHHDTAKLSDSSFVTVNYRDDNIVKLRSEDGRIIQELSGIRPTHNMSICSIETDINDNIWIAAPREHFIGQFDIDGNLLFKYECNKGLNPGKFDNPNHLFSSKRFIYVADSGNRKIAKIDLLNYSVSTYLDVPEPVYHFEQTQNMEIYQLLSGIYYSVIGYEVQTYKRKLP